MKVNHNVAFIGVCILLILLPFFISNDYIIILLDQTLISIIVLVGLNFITGLMGQMNLGTAGIMAFGAYTSAILTTRLYISPWIALIFVILMGVIIGIGLGYPSLRIKGIYLALTTLGFSEISRIVINNLINLTGGPTGIRNIPGFNILGFTINNGRSFYYLLLAFTVILLLFAVGIIKSKWGRAIKAVGDNDLAVEASGIRLSSIKIFAFTLCCVYGCIGGALYAHLIGYISPTDFSMEISIRHLMMLMIGGIGSTSGNILGALIVNLLPELLRFLGNYYWLIFSIIVLLCSIFIPKGLISIVKIGWKKIFDSVRKKVNYYE